MSSDTLHKRVVFVGDKPSKDNIRPDIPFIGTKSYSTLLQWIYVMDVDIRNAGMVNASDLRNPVFWNSRDLYKNFRVIALGKKASSFLKQAKVDFFELPHPSGLNRRLNNKKELHVLLDECRKYIYEE